MVLEVFADAGQIMQHRTAGRLQHRRRADAGALQEMRRADRAGRDQHLSGRLGDMPGAALLVFHAHGALALEEDAPGHRMGDDDKVRPSHSRLEVGVGGRPAHAVLDGHVHGAEAFLHVAVRVVGGDVAGFAAGIDEGAVERVLHLVAGIGGERAGVATIGIAAVLPVLGTLEVGQAVGVTPAARTEFGPLVEIASMAAHVDQAVDRGGAAEHLAARAVHAPAV